MRVRKKSYNHSSFGKCRLRKDLRQWMTIWGSGSVFIPDESESSSRAELGPILGTTSLLAVKFAGEGLISNFFTCSRTSKRSSLPREGHSGSIAAPVEIVSRSDVCFLQHSCSGFVFGSSFRKEKLSSVAAKCACSTASSISLHVLSRVLFANCSIVLKRSSPPRAMETSTKSLGFLFAFGRTSKQQFLRHLPSEWIFSSVTLLIEKEERACKSEPHFCPYRHQCIKIYLWSYFATIISKTYPTLIIAMKYLYIAELFLTKYFNLIIGPWSHNFLF